MQCPVPTDRVALYALQANVAPLLANAAAAGVDEVLVNDDSHDVAWAEAARRWRRASGGAAMRLHVSLSPNVHEIRAYNTLSRVANGRILAFAQDDNLMGGTDWASKAIALFDAYPSLGLLAGRRSTRIHGPHSALPPAAALRPQCPLTACHCVHCRCKWSCALNMTSGLQRIHAPDQLVCPLTGVRAHGVHGARTHHCIRALL
jgi:hypothetical protein